MKVVTMRITSLLLVLSLLLVATCALADQAPANAVQNNASGQPIRILSAHNVNSGSGLVISNLLSAFQAEHPDFKWEWETIPNHDQYYQKLRTYIAGGNIPDIINVAGNTYDATLASRGTIVDLRPVLEELGYLDKFYPSAISYQSFKNGFMFAMPESINVEMFWYWKADFEKAGIQETPKTFDEFLSVCDKLKAAGLTPISVSGKETWQLLRYLSFIPYRMTELEFTDSFKKGESSFGEEPGRKSLELMEKMAANNYFQPGFANMDYTEVNDYFLAHNSSMYYMGSWEAANMAPLYEAGEVGFFLLPDVDGVENRPIRSYLGAGFGLGFAQESWNDTMKEFVKFYCENYGAEAVKVGIYPPMNDVDISSLSKLWQDLAPVIADVPRNVIVWDVALDPTTNMEMGSLANELLLGAITADQFIETIDQVAKENAPLFYTDEVKDLF